MFDKAEAKYNELLKKKGIVEADKAKIEAVIAELDEKKNQALMKAYEQVNRDFGSIFSTLLPGTQAKLIPAEGTTVLDGLEVKVRGWLWWLVASLELWVRCHHGILCGVCCHDGSCVWRRGVFMVLSLVDCLWRGVEGEPHRAQRWTTIPRGAVAHSVAAAVQASAAVHPGRGGCCS